MAGDALVLAACALTGRGVKKLGATDQSPATPPCSSGTSGVGKSSLINRLYGEDIQATVEVRTSDAKGRHTTSWREMILLPQGGVVIDTPGMREFHLWIASEGSKQTFPEFDALSVRCHFRDCTHTRRISVRCWKRSPPARSRASDMTVSSNSNSKSASCAKPKREPLTKPVRKATTGAIACQAWWIEQPFSDNTGINTVDLCDNGLWVFHREHFIRHF